MQRPIKKLVALLQYAINWEEEYYGTLSNIDSEDENFQNVHHTPPRPVVVLPMATAFNAKVAMNLKKWND